MGADGVPRYRGGGVQGYEVQRPFPLSDSVARANQQYGDGGLLQHYLPMDLDDLERLGCICTIEHIPTDDVVARIPVEGRPVPRGVSA